MKTLTIDRRIFLSGLGASFTLASLPLTAAEPAAAQSTPPATPLLFGVDYYPDQTPEPLWPDDIKRMAAAGVTNVRIAEFAWALMEPAEGRFDFAWLHRACDLLHAAGIAIILGTPSAAPPPWLTLKYPQVFEVNLHGLTLGPEGRRFTCPTNPLYRDLSNKVAAAMAKSFVATPGVIGWQIDNELTLSEFGRCYCPYCRTGFQQWLKQKYGTLDKLNSAWGTAFWSQVYTDFLQIPVPLPSGGPPNPGMALDYDRYQSAANVGFQQVQLDTLRRLCPKHFLTTNNVILADTIDNRDLYANLDFVCTDNYPGFIAVRALGAESGASLPGQYLAPTVSLGHDFTRSAKGKPFLVMEQQSGKAGQETLSPQPFPGQLRLWSYQAVAHGAMGINYFRWDTANFGAEEYWHGLLTHARTNSPGFDEITQTIRELKQLGAEALHADFAADAALIFDYSSDWALGIQPGQPKLKYTAELIAWYTAATAAGASLDIVDATADIARYKVVIAPVMYVVSAAQAQRIIAYVQGGGTFIGSYRLGVKDETSHIVGTPLPGPLAEVMGVTVEDYVPIYSDPQSIAFGPQLKAPDAKCSVWADILKPTTATTLATYTTAEHAGKPAITTNTFGKGKAIYIGAHLETPALTQLLTTFHRAAGITPAFTAPAGVEITQRRAHDKTWTYILNHTAQPQTLTLSGTDALTNQPITGPQTLAPYAAKVLTT